MVVLERTKTLAQKQVPSLQHKIFWALTLVSVLASVVIMVSFAAVYQAALLHEVHTDLARECSAVSSAIDVATNTTKDEIAVLAATNFGEVRATLVAPTGQVLYDSTTDAAALPNHLDRPEIKEAFEGGVGSAERDSQTLNFISIYEAKKITSGNVIRLAVDRNSVMGVLVRDVGFMLAVLAVVVLVCWLVSRYLAKRMVEPILAINPVKASQDTTYRELAPLVERLYEQQEALNEQVENLRDVDAMRQEFTANVTHELKTPIASIMGAAELVRDGIARSQDVPEFTGRIYDDAQRLSSLVSDILTLSKLDESERAGDIVLFGQVEPVDLYEVAKDVCRRAQGRAHKLGVSLFLEGTSSVVMGHRRLLDEMMANLVDNALRYNRVGGSVYVFVLPIEGTPAFCVRDTGVGIPVDAQDKIFERFYRVDKSRSRAGGGTGLGLAIVKHAALLHKAQIKVSSKVGEGTRIDVIFSGNTPDAPK